MKKINALIFILVSQISIAQVDGFFEYVSATRIPLAETKDNTIKGSPYYLGGKFIKGIIYNGDKIIDNVDLRYNSYADFVEVMLSEREIYQATKQKTYFFNINGQRVYLFNFKDGDGKYQEGYLFCGFCSDEVSLLKRYETKFHKKTPAKNGYQEGEPDRYETKESYYLKFGDDRVVKLEGSKKKIVSQFPEHQAKLADFIKDKKLKLRDENELIELVEYYRALLN